MGASLDCDRWHGFNPRVREDATLIACLLYMRDTCFNPRVREDATATMVQVALAGHKFQSTRP